MVGKKKIFGTIADILWHVPSKVPEIDCSWHFMVLYLDKIPSYHFHV